MRRNIGLAFSAALIMAPFSAVAESTFIVCLGQKKSTCESIATDRGFTMNFWWPCSGDGVEYKALNADGGTDLAQRICGSTSTNGVATVDGSWRRLGSAVVGDTCGYFVNEVTCN